MAYYLIDFENVNAGGLEGIDNLTGKDSVYIFYSKHSDKIDFEIVDLMLNTKAELKSIKVSVGSKNALDFQLSSYLGYLISNDKKGEYYIISKDNGFSALEKFWEEKDVKVRIRPDCNITKKIVSINKKLKLSEHTKIENFDRELFEKINEKINDEAMAIYVTDVIMKETELKQVNNAISKKIRNSKKSSLIYRAVKPFIKEKNKNTNLDKKENQNSQKAQIKFDNEVAEKIEKKIQNKEISIKIINILKKYKNFAQIHNALNKEIKDSKKTKVIYKSIKPIIKA